MERKGTLWGDGLMRNSWAVVMTGVEMKGSHGSNMLSELQPG